MIDCSLFTEWLCAKRPDPRTAFVCFFQEFASPIRSKRLMLRDMLVDAMPCARTESTPQKQEAAIYYGVPNDNSSHVQLHDAATTTSTTATTGAVKASVIPKPAAFGVAFLQASSYRLRSRPQNTRPLYSPQRRFSADAINARSNSSRAAGSLP